MNESTIYQASSLQFRELVISNPSAAKHRHCDPENSGEVIPSLRSTEIASSFLFTMLKKIIKIKLLGMLMFFVFFSNSSFCQQIDSMYVYPSTPTQGDSVYLVVHLTFPTVCEMNSYNVDISGSNINVNVNYCVSTLFAACYRVDTIFLGVLHSDSVSLSFNLLIDDYFPFGYYFPCSSFLPFKSQSLSFNILPDCGNSLPPTSIHIETNEVCYGDSIKLKVLDGILGAGATWLWFTDSCNGNYIGAGDSIFVSPVTNTSYFVRADDCGLFTCKTVSINVNYPPEQTLHVFGSDTSLCAGDTLLLSAPYGYNYLWQDGSSDSVFTVTGQGTYFVQISNQCGSASDTVQISYQAPPVISLGNDTVLCAGDTLLLTAPIGYDYLWQDTSLDSVFTVTQQGTYFVEISNLCGSTSDTVQISYQAPPVISLGNDTTLCAGDTLLLPAPYGYNYLWQDGSTDTVFSVTSPNIFWLIVNNICGTVSDTIEVSYSYPIVDTGQDTVVCNNSNISLDAGIWHSYEWSTGATGQTISLSNQNTILTVWLNVEDEYGCFASDTLLLTFETCLGLNTQDKFSDISIFPNPAKNEINIHIKNYDESPFHCQIINPQGQLVKTFEISNENYLLNTYNIATGVYYLIGENKNQKFSKKVVIIK